MRRGAWSKFRGGTIGGRGFDDSDHFAGVLWFESLALEELYGGRVGLSLTPYIGLYRVGFLEEVRVLARIAYGGGANVVRGAGDEVAVYLLHYGNYVKVGSSSVSNVVGRMFSQAPLCGMVVTSLIFKERASSEEVLDRYLVRRVRGLSVLRGANIRTRREYVGGLVNRIVRGAVDPKTLIDGLIGIANAMYGFLWDEDVLHRYEPLLPPSRYWFTMSICDEDIEFLKKLRASGTRYGVPSGLKHVNELVKGTLTVLHNALCVVGIENKTYIDYCDKVSRNMLFEVV
ncbi:MAG: hypothetical protein QW348_06820 [Ignisphaera sp.]